MPKRRGEPSNGPRKSNVVRSRRTLNAFRIDKDDEPAESREAEETLEMSDDEGVKSEDDEEIDSDEAFDESDDEKYSSFKFSGSSSKTVKGKQKAGQPQGTGDLEEEEEDEDEDDDEMYMDLSEMLSQGQSTNGTTNARKHGPVAEESGSESEDEESDGSDESILEASDSEGDEQLDNLGAFVESLASNRKKPEKQPDKEPSPLKESIDVPKELAMTDILASLTDPSLQSFRKSLAAQQTSKSKNVGQKLSAPLARPLQAKLERQAAYEETKTEITKWQATVKANREADHLQFPMNEPPKQSKQSNATLAGTFQPSTSLEKNVDELLKQSGIREEKDVTAFEELALKSVSIDEVRARQAQLRAMRELMFRQEQKARRIAKIKSKSYRRIHKREREREMEKRMAEEGEDGEELRDKRMKMEVARAKERMTLKHKNTGDWAKKMLSRGQHDAGTRQAISEQIRRGDELQRKILGVEQSDESGESDSGEELDDLLRDPNKWGEETVETNPDVLKGVMGMKFMRDADERQRRANLDNIREIQDALDARSDDDDTPRTNSATVLTENPGRKTFIPGDQMEQPDKTQRNRENVEEVGEEVVLKIVKNPFHMDDSSRNGVKKSISSSTSRIATDQEPSTAAAGHSSWLISSKTQDTSTASTVSPADNAWLAPAPRSSKKQTSENRINKIQAKRKRDELENADDGVDIDASIERINDTLGAAQAELEDEDAPTMTYGRGKIAFKQNELLQRAFATDAFEQDFAAEKEAAIAEDAPKEEDLTLPGWGVWTGQGVKRRATEKKLVKKIPGIEESKRKDAKLKNVIINEKRVKNNTKYLAGAVPYPFETREQYERSLSMPIGPEWTTREMYQKVTKPRVTIRAGAVVNPLEAPFR